VHVLRDRFPVELDRLQDLHWDRFDIGEELGEALLGAFPDRRQRQGAIAEDDARRAVLGREGAERVPGNLRVVVAMIVDKAGADRAPVGVDRPRGRAGQFADLGDLAVLDADIGPEARHAGAVDDAAVLNQQVIRHRALLPGLSSVRSAARRATLTRGGAPTRAFAAWIMAEPCNSALYRGRRHAACSA